MRRNRSRDERFRSHSGLELQGYGILVLATKVGAIPEGASNGDAALLCGANSHELAEGLSRLMADASLRRKLAVGSLCVSRSRLWGDLTKQLEDAYDLAIKSRQRGRLTRCFGAFLPQSAVRRFRRD